MLLVMSTKGIMRMNDVMAFIELVPDRTDIVPSLSVRLYCTQKEQFVLNCSFVLSVYCLCYGLDLFEALCCGYS